jgi:hypothetical protein
MLAKSRVGKFYTLKRRAKKNAKVLKSVGYAIVLMVLPVQISLFRLFVLHFGSWKALERKISAVQKKGRSDCNALQINHIPATNGRNSKRFAGDGISFA